MEFFISFLMAMEECFRVDCILRFFKPVLKNYPKHQKCRGSHCSEDENIDNIVPKPIRH